VTPTKSVQSAGTDRTPEGVFRSMQGGKTGTLSGHRLGLRCNRKLLEDVLEGLFHVAKADEEMHPQEEQFPRRVAKLFGFSDTEFSYIKARHVIAAKRNPYDVLGVEPSVSDEKLKSRYHMIVEENHPDKLMARGVPKELVTIATEKVTTLREAYDAIVKERSI
jgi:DnaJ like chaperone protein